MTSFQCGGPALIKFFCCDRKWPGFIVGIEIDLFLCGGQNRHRFSLRAENYLVIIYISELTWFLAWGSKLTWFSCAGRKWLALIVGIDWVSFRAGGRNWLDFYMLAENQLVLEWASNLTSFLSGWSKMTWFYCGVSNLTWVHGRDHNWFGLDVWVERRGFALGLTYTCFVYEDRNWSVICTGIGLPCF